MVATSAWPSVSTRGVGLVKIFPLSEAAVNKHLKWGGHLKPKDKTEAELSKAISLEASPGLNRGA